MLTNLLSREVVNGGGNGLIGPDGRPDVWARFYFFARQGHTYRLAVDSYQDYGGIVTVQLTQQPGPANDLFQNRLTISGSSVTVTNSNQYAWKEPNEPTHAGHGLGASLWWTWTVPETAVYRFDTSLSGHPTAFSVYDGDSLTNLTVVAENGLVSHPPVENYDRFHFQPRGAQTVQLDQGKVLQIAVDVTRNISFPTATPAGSWPFHPAAHLVLDIQRVSGPTVVPSNDSFGDPITIAGTSANVTGDTFAATREIGEPSLTGANQTGTLWFDWTAAETGVVAVTNLNSEITNSFQPWIGVYTGTTRTNLNLVASNNFAFGWGNCGSGWYARNAFEFKVTSAQRYMIAVGGGPGVVEKGAFQIGWSFVPAPANASFENRQSLQGQTISLSAVSNVGAFKESGEPDHGENAGGSSVWFQWRADQTGTAEVSLDEPAVFVPPVGGVLGASQTSQTGSQTSDPECASGRELNPPAPYFPVLGVYTGSTVSSLTAVAGGSNVVYRVAAGTDYQLAMDGNLGSMGTADLFLTFTAPPSNDQFANRIQLSGTNAFGQGYLRSSTVESNEPIESGSGSVWFSWSPDTYGTANVAFHTADGNYRLSVYTGDQVDQLTLLATGTGPLSFFGKPELTYLIAVSSDEIRAGNYEIRFSAPPVQPLQPTTATEIAQGHEVRFESAPNGLAVIQARSGSDWTNVFVGTVTSSQFTLVIDAGTVAASPQFRLLQITATLPHLQPRVSLTQDGGAPRLQIRLEGIHQQRFLISEATSLGSWTPLSTNALSVDGDQMSFNAIGKAKFFRVTPLWDE